MKIEHIAFYDEHNRWKDNVIDMTIYAREFHSLLEIADILAEHLRDIQVYSCIVFVDNCRFMVVRQNSFDVHYSQSLNK